MTHDQLMAALSPARLPLEMADLSLPEMLVLLALGLLVGLAAAAVIVPFTRRRTAQTRSGPAALRDLPVPERLLGLARWLGHLPAALRPAAYGAAPPPSDRRIARIVRGARLRRLWSR